jgi:hypothetical protein
MEIADRITTIGAMARTAFRILVIMLVTDPSGRLVRCRPSGLPGLLALPGRRALLSRRDPVVLSARQTR